MFSEFIRMQNAAGVRASLVATGAPAQLTFRVADPKGEVRAKHFGVQPADETDAIAATLRLVLIAAGFDDEPAPPALLTLVNRQRGIRVAVEAEPMDGDRAVVTVRVQTDGRTVIRRRETTTEGVVHVIEGARSDLQAPAWAEEND